MRRSERAFTLLEVLVAMSLFTVVGFAVVMLMSTGVEMWIRGNRGSMQVDRQEQSLPRLGDDLRMLIVPAQRDRIPFDPANPDPDREPEPRIPENRMLSGYLSVQMGDTVYPCRYLSFVRQSRGLPEVELYEARAGRNSKADAYIDGKNDEEEFKNGMHLATGGGVEVLWIWLPDEDRKGVGTLYRAYRSPVGGAGTLLDPRNFDSLKRIREELKPQPIVQAVLHFDLLFWTQYTTSWEWSKDEPRVTRRPDKSAGGTLTERPACGPSRTWDSTRGIFTDRDFRLSRGQASAGFTGDDIWPRMVRVEFCLREEETSLARDFGGGDRDFTVVSGDFATGRGELVDVPMKIGAEWIEVRARDSVYRDRFIIGRRAQRETREQSHSEGTPVYFGQMFDTTITVPAFRDDNN